MFLKTKSYFFIFILYFVTFRVEAQGIDPSNVVSRITVYTQNQSYGHQSYTGEAKVEIFQGNMLIGSEPDVPTSLAERKSAALNAQIALAKANKQNIVILRSQDGQWLWIEPVSLSAVEKGASEEIKKYVEVLEAKVKELETKLQSLSTKSNACRDENAISDLSRQVKEVEKEIKKKEKKSATKQ